MTDRITIRQPDGSYRSVPFIAPTPVTEGDTVSTGQIIGYTGSSGAQFSHLSAAPASPKPDIPVGTTPQAFRLKFDEPPLA